MNTFQEWLSVLYSSKEVCLVDHAIEKGWESLILAEYLGLVEELDMCCSCIINMRDNPWHDPIHLIQFEEERFDLDFRIHMLLSCLRHCYPPCPVCKGDYTSGGEHSPCPDCTQGILLPK